MRPAEFTLGPGNLGGNAAQTMTSTKISLRRVTYAQIFSNGIETARRRHPSRYQSHSATKSLIHNESLKCFFSGHSSESLDSQGFQAHGAKLSTKLSTKTRDILKAALNQALSAVFECNYADSRRLTAWP
jgi:hypothetical protein